MYITDLWFSPRSSVKFVYRTVKANIINDISILNSRFVMDIRISEHFGIKQEAARSLSLPTIKKKVDSPQNPVNY